MHCPMSEPAYWRKTRRKQFKPFSFPRFHVEDFVRVEGIFFEKPVSFCRKICIFCKVKCPLIILSSTGGEDMGISRPATPAKRSKVRTALVFSMRLQLAFSVEFPIAPTLFMRCRVVVYNCLAASHTVKNFFMWPDELLRYIRNFRLSK